MKIHLLLLCLLALAACGPQDKELARIAELRDRLKENREMVKQGKAKTDSLTILELGRALQAYVAGHPKVQQAPEMLLEAAHLYEGGLGDGQKAYTLYEEIYKKHEKSREAEEALIRMASIAHAEPHLQQLAERLYKAYVARYPDGKHIRTAREAIIFFETDSDSLALPEAARKQIK